MAGDGGTEATRMRVAILSDTHGLVDPRILDAIGGCELAIHGGDIGGAAVLDEVAARVGRLLAVTGNNDLPHKWPAADHHRLQALPEEIRVPLPGGPLVVVHGHRLPARCRHERLRRLHADARCVVYGHSHRLVVDRDEEPWILNPGAAGRSRTYGGPSCLLLHAGLEHWSVETLRLPLPAPRRGSGIRRERTLNTLYSQD